MGNLGFQNSIKSCARSCLDRSNCKFAAFRHDSGLGHCTGFTSCTIQENPNEFTVIEIQAQDSTSPQFFDVYGTKGGSPSETTCHIDSRLTTFYRIDINECETRCASEMIADFYLATPMERVSCTLIVIKRAVHITAAGRDNART